MWGDFWRQEIQSLGWDFEANKKGSTILQLEEIFSSAASFEEGRLKLNSLKWYVMMMMPPSASAGNRVNLFHLHFSPLSRPVPAFEHPTQEE